MPQTRAWHYRRTRPLACSAVARCCKTTITMRRHISTDIKRLVLRLATVRGYKYKKIHEISGVSVRTTKRICALHRQTGDVVKKRIIDGGPRLLNGFHISVNQLLLLQSCSGGEVADSWQEGQIAVVQHWVYDNGECSAGQGANLHQT